MNSSTTTPSPSQGAPTPQALAVGETASIEGGSGTVRSVQAQRAIAALDSSGVHTKVVRPPGQQFVVVQGTMTDPLSFEQARNALRLQLNGELFEISRYYFSQGAFDGFGLPFTVPLDVQAKQAAVLWKKGGTAKARWNLSEGFVEHLNNTPAFKIKSFTVPERASAGSEIPVTVTVANAGEGAGKFLAELGVMSTSSLPNIQFPVSQGQTKSQQASVHHQAEPGEQVTVVLDSGLERFERPVDIYG